MQIQTGHDISILVVASLVYRIALICINDMSIVCNMTGFHKARGKEALSINGMREKLHLCTNQGRRDNAFQHLVQHENSIF